MTINLNNAAKYYKEEPHQVSAWNFLESKLSDELLDQFADLYRAAPANPTSNLITPEIMNELTGYPASSFDATFCTDFNKLLSITGFDKHLDATAMLTANCMHETANFIYMKEIADGWAYEGRKDLGNIHPGDGPKFKGAGVLQLTGRYNYTRASEKLSDPKIVERGVDYTCEQYPFRSALCWIEDNDLLNICLTKGFDACCVKINGGWNGYDDRLAKYKIAKKVFGVKQKQYVIDSMTIEERQAFWEAVESGSNPLLSVMHGLVEKWGLPALIMCLGDIAQVLSEDAETAELTANQRGLILGACAQVCQLSDQMHAEMEFLTATENG